MDHSVWGPECQAAMMEHHHSLLFAILFFSVSPFLLELILPALLLIPRALALKRTATRLKETQQAISVSTQLSGSRESERGRERERERKGKVVPEITLATRVKQDLLL